MNSATTIYVVFVNASEEHQYCDETAFGSLKDLIFFNREAAIDYARQVAHELGVLGVIVIDCMRIFNPTSPADVFVPTEFPVPIHVYNGAGGYVAETLKTFRVNVN